MRRLTASPAPGPTVLVCVDLAMVATEKTSKPWEPSPYCKKLFCESKSSAHRAGAGARAIGTSSSAARAKAQLRRKGRVGTPEAVPMT